MKALPRKKRTLAVPGIIQSENDDSKSILNQ
jgi:hypothetical protein